MAKSKKKGLGRGLGALISAPNGASEAAREPDTPGTQSDEGRVLQLDPSALEPNPKQPRKAFNEEALQDLADSIRRDGVQEPVIVRKVGDKYQLISGERRVRASIMADQSTVPAICKQVSDDDMLKLGLIENIQREDLNAIELAESYQQLIEEFDWTQEELAEQVGKKRATIANTMRLLNLPTDVQRAVADGAITMGHARALLALDTAQAQSAVCRKVVEQGLSVRQVEKLAADAAKPKIPTKAPEKDPNIAHIEDELRRSLGTRVNMKTGSNNRGKIEIEYYNLDDLERLLDILRG